MGTTKENLKPRKRPTQERSRRNCRLCFGGRCSTFRGGAGHEGTTTNHVAERAGVSIGSVYQYFPNKESLLLALAERHLAEARGRASVARRRLREEGVSPEEYFRGFVGFVVDFHQGGEPLHELFFEEAPRSKRLVEL